MKKLLLPETKVKALRQEVSANLPSQRRAFLEDIAFLKVNYYYKRKSVVFGFSFLPPIAEHQSGFEKRLLCLTNYFQSSVLDLMSGTDHL